MGNMECCGKQFHERIQDRQEYQYLLMTGKLTEHLNAVDQEAREQVEVLMKQMSKQLVVTEELKSKNQMEWVGKMNNIKSDGGRDCASRNGFICNDNI